MIENLIVLLLLSLLVATAKTSKEVGYMVISYYVIYIALEVNNFGVVLGDVFTTFPQFIIWYIVCGSLSALFSLWASILYMTHGGAIWIYAAWLIFDAVICSILALSQTLETNDLLFMYNVLQNINIYVDIIIVMVSTDNIIKRKSSSAASIIDNINAGAERWLSMVSHSINKGT